MRNAIFIIVLLVFASCEDPFIEYQDYTVLEEVLYDVGEDENNSEEDVTEEEDVEEVIFECSQSVILKSQAEVDAFGQLNCSEVGDIWIEEIDGIITNLKSLKSLKTINGNLAVKGTSIFNFEGLQNIDNITGSVLIEDNFLLFSVYGLQNVKSLTELIIVNNVGLVSIELFNGLISLRNLTLTGNSDLVELDGFHNIKTIEQHLLIQDNITLLNISGLGNISKVKNISILGNSLLSDFCAFKSVLQSRDFTGYLITELNLFNPAEEDIISGNCKK